MTTYTGKHVFLAGRRGVVTAEVIGKKGKPRLTIRFDDGGTAENVGYGLVRVQESCGPAAEFAPACTIEEFFKPLPSSAQALRNKINHY